MATSSKRDTQLSIGVTTSGQDAVKTLRDAVAGLAKEGGDAAPEFQRLIAEIDKLGTQQSAIDQFVTLKRETVDLSASMTQAAANVDRLGAQLPEVAAATQRLAQAQNEAKTAFDGQKALLEEARQSLSKLRAEYTGSARSTDEYKVAAGELKSTIAQLSTNVKESRAEYTSASEAAKQAAAAEKTLSAEFNASLNTAKQLSTALGARNRALDESRASLAANGIETNNLNQAQTGLKNTLDQITTEINQQVTATTQARAAQQAFATIANDVAAALEKEQVAAQNAARTLQQEEQAIAAVAAATAKYLAEQQAATAATEKAEAEQKALAAATAKAAIEWQQEAEALVNARIATDNHVKDIEKMIAVQRELAAQDAFAKTAAQAKKLVDAGNYVRFWEQALEEAEATQRKVAESAKQAATALDNAFAKTGVRAANAIQTEIAQVSSALQLLASNTRVSGAEFDRAFAAGQARIKSLEAELRGVPEAVTQTGGAVSYLKQQFSQLAAIYGGIQLGQAFIEANTQIETLRRTLTFVTGSSAAAAKQIALLQDVANKTGVSVGSITDAFVRFQASASQAGIQSQVVQDLFVGISAAAGKMGLSSDRVALSLEAISQIAGKGVVSMEELRGQLGDSLPGAMAIAARSTGLTVSQFTKLVETGQVLSEDFLPLLSAELKKTFGDGTTQVEGFAQAWNRLKNSITLVAQQAADSSAFKALASTMDFLAKNMQSVVDGGYAIGKAFVALKAIQIAGEFTGISAALRANALEQERNALAVTQRAAAQRASVAAQEAATLVTVANTVVTVENTVAAKANALAWGTMESNLARSTAATATAATSMGLLGRAATAGGGAIRGLSALVGGLPGLLLATVVSGKEVGTWLGEGAAKWLGYGKRIEEAEAKMKATDEALRKSGETARALPASWLQVAAGYATATAAAEKSILTQTKLAEAAKAVADTSVKVAQLSGNEAEARTVAANAALNLVSAYQKVSDSQKAQLTLLEQERAALIASVGGEQNLRGAKLDAIKAIDQKIERSKAETAQAVAATEAAKEEAASRTLTVQVNNDNAASLDTLKAAYLGAVESAKFLTAALKEGFATQETVNAANIAAATAERLYIDALDDTVKALQRKAAQQVAATNSAKAANDVEVQQAITAEKYADSIGNQYGVVQAKITQKELEIKATELNVTAMQNEAKSSIAVAEAKKAELEASGALTLDKKAEIDLSIAAAQAKLKEADASKEKVKQLQIELNNLRINGTTQGQVSQSNVNAIHTEISAREQLIATREKELDLSRREAALAEDARQSKNTAGQTVQQELPTYLSILNQLKSYGLGDKSADQIAKQFTDARGQVPYFDNPGQKKYGQFGDTLGAAVQRAASAEIYQNGGTANPDKTTTSASGATGTSRTVNVVINGRPTAVNVASDTDATTLENLIKTLGQAASTSS
jgi:tape measure domain-containing protein